MKRFGKRLKGPLAAARAASGQAPAKQLLSSCHEKEAASAPSGEASELETTQRSEIGTTERSETWTSGGTLGDVPAKTKKKRVSTIAGPLPPSGWGKLRVDVDTDATGMLRIAFAGEPYARADVMGRELTMLRERFPVGRAECAAPAHRLPLELVDRMWDVFAEYVGPVAWVHRVVEYAESNATPAPGMFARDEKGRVAHARFVAAVAAWRRRSTDEGELKRGVTAGAGAGAWPSIVRLLRALEYPLPENDRSAAEAIRGQYEKASGKRARNK